MKKYHVIGIMSGTSLDGVDIAACSFTQSTGKWSYQIKKAETIPYSPEWKNRLTRLPHGSAIEFAKTHVDFGKYLGQLSAEFIRNQNLQAEFIGSHGHTIFHQPHKGFTSQIGNGASIAAETGLPVVNNFRTMDVALGGQGAPLVPIGDKLLFSEFDFRLNIGGIANISYEKGKNTVAYDIAPANMGFNHFSQLIGLPYDEGGALAQKGKLIYRLYEQLNALPFYKQTKTKSLGREWFETEFLPFIKQEYKTEDILHTLVLHLAYQINATVKKAEITKTKPRILITGGGAYNTFLIDCLASLNAAEIVIPPKLLIEYKEALIFAFLAVLRIEKLANSLSTVTGASQNSIGGAVHWI